MESLPDLVMWKIAEYLDGGEVAAWSAVSHRCRNSLNQDVVWQRFCNPQTAEYTSQTECQVEPGFTVPIVQNAGLTDICESRLAFMRQIHLWNNWRNKNCVSYSFPRDWEHFAFYKNNYIVACYSKEEELAIGIWDVKTSPVQICQKTLSFDRNIDSFCVVNNRIVVVQDNILQTFQFSISSTKNEIEFEHSFSIEVNYGKDIQVFDKLLVSVSEDERSLKVWDIETGELVKELRSLNTSYSMPYHDNANYDISNDGYLKVIAHNFLNNTRSVIIYLMPDLTEICKCNIHARKLRGSIITVTKYYVFICPYENDVLCYNLKTGEHLFTSDEEYNHIGGISMKYLMDNKLFFNSHDYFTNVLAMFQKSNLASFTSDLVPLDGNYFLYVRQPGLYDYFTDKLSLAWVKNGEINHNFYKRPYFYDKRNCNARSCVINPSYTKLVVRFYDCTGKLLTFW